MKRIFAIILLVGLLVSQVGIANLPPLRISGILQTLAVKFVMLFPNRSVVDRGGVIAYIDTDHANLLHDGDFEGIALSASWTLSNGTGSLLTSNNISGGQHFNISATAQTPVLNQEVATTAGLNGLASCWVKTSSNLAQVCSSVDGVDVSCLNAPSDDEWKLYKIPLITGSNSGVTVKTSGSITDDIEIDKCKFEYGDAIQAIAQSELAGESYFAGTTGCQPIRQSLTIGAFNTDVDCPAPTVLTQNLGEWQTTDANLIRQTINNLPVGEYKATFIIPHENTISARTAWAINDGTTTCEATEGIQAVAGSISVVVTCVFKYSSAGNRVFEIYAGSTNASNEIRIQNQLASPRTSSRFFLEYYPPKSHIVTQNQELTAQTANTLSARILGSNCTLIAGSENITGWITSTTDTGAGDCTVNYSGLALTATPSIQNSIVWTGGTQFGELLTPTTTSVHLTNSTTAGSLADPVEYHITLFKNGADFNKSQIVYGTFEQIKTTELCEVEAYGNNGETISGAGVEDISWNTEVSDTCGIYNDSGNTGELTNDAIVPTRTGFYAISLSTRYATASNNQIDIYKNGATYETMGFATTSGLSTVSKFTAIVKLDASQTYTFRIGTGGSFALQQTEEEKYHKFTLTELPDLAGIVKNLNDNKNVKCQTKQLSANYTGTSTIADLTFSNLVIGRKYKFISNFQIQENGGGNIIREWYVRALNGATTLGNALLRFDNQAFPRESRALSRQFTATDTALTFFQLYNQNTLTNGGSLFSSYVTLCELPDNYIETTEF